MLKQIVSLAAKSVSWNCFLNANISSCCSSGLSLCEAGKAAFTLEWKAVQHAAWQTGKHLSWKVQRPPFRCLLWPHRWDHWMNCEYFSFHCIHCISVRSTHGLRQAFEGRALKQTCPVALGGNLRDCSTASYWFLGENAWKTMEVFLVAEADFALNRVTRALQRKEQQAERQYTPQS